jgi:hypothetical protein
MTTPQKAKAKTKKNRHVKDLKIHKDVEKLMEPMTKEEFEATLKKASRKAALKKN